MATGRPASSSVAGTSRASPVATLRAMKVTWTERVPIWGAGSAFTSSRKWLGRVRPRATSRSTTSGSTSLSPTRIRGGGDSSRSETVVNAEITTSRFPGDGLSSSARAASPRQRLRSAPP